MLHVVPTGRQHEYRKTKSSDSLFLKGATVMVILRNMYSYTCIDCLPEKF